MVSNARNRNEEQSLRKPTQCRSTINNDQNIRIDTDACYEELASQEEKEELYLEETEEGVVAILASYVSPASKSDRSTIDLRGARIQFGDRGGDGRPNEPSMVRNADEQLVGAIEELILGDSNDPPLREDSVQEMLNDSPSRGPDR